MYDWFGMHPNALSEVAEHEERRARTPREVLIPLLCMPAWDRLDDAMRELVARAVCRWTSSPVELARIETFSLGAEHRIAIYRNDGVEWALVPGGTVELGWDRSSPLDPFEELWREGRGDGHLALAVHGAEQPATPDRLFDWLDKKTSLRRSIELRPFLVERVARTSDTSESEIDPHSYIARAVVERGHRLLTPDEWEHACSGGTSTLFRWGEQWPRGNPLDWGDPFVLHRKPNAFGLTITADPYKPEVTCDPLQLRGGDGGKLVCGGATSTAWITFATSFAFDLDGYEFRREAFEQVLVRRALSVFPSESDRLVQSFVPPSVRTSARVAERELQRVIAAFPGFGLSPADREAMAREIGDLDAMIVVHRYDPRVQQLGALVLLKLERTGEALATAKHAHELSPDWDACTTLGTVHRFRGETSNAVARYDEAFGLDKSDAGPLLDAGDALLNAGEWRRALAFYKRVLGRRKKHDWAFPSALLCRQRLNGKPIHREKLERYVGEQPHNERAAWCLAQMRKHAES